MVTRILHKRLFFKAEWFSMCQPLGTFSHVPKSIYYALQIFCFYYANHESLATQIWSSLTLVCKCIVGREAFLHGSEYETDQCNARLVYMHHTTLLFKQTKQVLLMNILALFQFLCVDENNWRNDYPDEDEWSESSDEEPRYTNKRFDYG